MMTVARRVSMRIRDVRTTRVAVPLDYPLRFATRAVTRRDYSIVEVETDDGLVGIGLTWWHHPALIIERYLAPHLIGADASPISAHWDRMYREVYRERKGGALCAVSAVDIALWDLRGKALGQPVYKLLGHARDRVRCYGSGGYYREGKGLDGLAREMRGFRAAGFRSVKMKFGGLPLAKDLERVRAARQALGHDIELLVDANNAYTSYEAIRAGRALERYHIGWFEEPCWPDDLAGAAAVAQALQVPVTAGELEYTLYGMRDILEAEAADILNPDVMFCGGISEFVRIGQLATTWQVPVTPHAAHDISAHLAAALPNCLAVEYFRPETDAMKDMLLYTATLVPEKGELRLPNRPGLGIELDQQAVARYRVG